MNMNIQMMRNTSLAASLFAASFSVSAADTSTMSFYLGAGISQTSLDVNQQNMALAYGTDPQSSYDTNGLGLKLIAGIKMDQYLAFEATYTDLGSIALDDGITQQKSFEADVLNISALLSHGISNNIDIYGKLGWSYWSTLDEDMDALESGSGIVYGAGLDVNVYGNKNRTMRIEWQHQEFDNITFVSADSMSVAAVFKF